MAMSEIGAHAAIQLMTKVIKVHEGRNDTTLAMSASVYSATEHEWTRNHLSSSLALVATSFRAAFENECANRNGFLRLVLLGFCSYSSAMRRLSNLLAVVICLGLMFQVSAQAASLPQSEAMTSADCSKMNHHASDGSEYSDHMGHGEDKPCGNMSMKCMLSMNVIAPVLMGNDLPALSRSVPSSGTQFSASEIEQLVGRPLTPEYPPPRI